MGKDIQTYQRASLDEKRVYAQMLAASGDLLPKGLWANIKNPDTGLMENRPSPAKVMLVVEMGLMLGLHPMAALQGIDIVENRPAIKPALMTALIRDAGHKLRIQTTGTLEGGDLAVTATGISVDDPDYPYASTWDLTRAKQAGLIDSYEPNVDGIWVLRVRSKNDAPMPWEQYPERMLRWRAVGDVGTALFEQVLMGMHYTPEELGGTVNDAGELVPEPTPAPVDVQADLLKRIDEATTAAEVNRIMTDARQQYGSLPDAVRTAGLTKLGMLGRAPLAIDKPAEAAVGPQDSVDGGEPAPDAEPLGAADMAPAEPERIGSRELTAEEIDDLSLEEWEQYQQEWLHEGPGADDE